MPYCSAQRLFCTTPGLYGKREERIWMEEGRREGIWKKGRREGIWKTLLCATPVL
jgi:hypothetical protein